MAVRDYLPNGIPFLQNEGFSEVYEAYEEFYKQAQVRNGRGRRREDAAIEFVQAVMDYTDASYTDVEAELAQAQPLALLGLDFTQEKMTEEELRKYLEGNLQP
jgi:hypothetical protein